MEASLQKSESLVNCRTKRIDHSMEEYLKNLGEFFSLSPPWPSPALKLLPPATAVKCYVANAALNLTQI